MSDMREAVARIVAAADPEGLLALGAPTDEYAPEVEDLARLVIAGAVTLRNVRAVWVDWFGARSTLAADFAALQALTDQLAALRR